MQLSIFFLLAFANFTPHDTEPGTEPDSDVVTTQDEGDQAETGAETPATDEMDGSDQMEATQSDVVDPSAEESGDLEDDSADAGGSLLGYRREDLSGYFWGRYRLRSTDDETDHDAYATVLVDVGNKETHKVTFSILARLHYELDGEKSDEDFFSIENTYESNAYGRLLRGYAAVHRLGFVEELRLGRQELETIVEIPLFDGVLFQTEETGDMNLRFRGFAGIPTHLFESSPSGDSIFGAGVDVEPFKGTRASLHFAGVRDSLTLGTERNAFFVLDLWQRLSQEASLTARGTVLEQNIRDVMARLNYLGADSGITASLSYFTLLKTQRRRVTEFDPYFDVLAEERPFHQVALHVSKDFGDQWTLAGGVLARELDDDSEDGAFNHEWRRYYITPTLRQWPFEGTEISVTGELWEAEDQAVRTAGVGINHQFSETFDMGVGTDYSLFKYNPILRDERENVRSVYARAALALDQALRLQMQVSLEDDSFDTYTAAEFGLRWRF